LHRDLKRRPEDNNIITNGEFGYMTLLPVQAVLQQKILMKTFSESLKRLQIYNMEKECFRMVTEGPRLVLWPTLQLVFPLPPVCFGDLAIHPPGKVLRVN
jgi:hypothetical protein